MIDIYFAAQRNFGTWGKWPNGIVKYQFHSSLTASDIVEVNKAFDVYHKKTCIRFQQRANGEAGYVSIENEPSVCGLAHVCRGGGYQFAQFGGSCRNAGVMVHELGHSLCFGHEQSRGDRDDYLSFPCGSGGGKDTGFDINLFYDYKSAMHYGCDNCMKPKMTDVSTSMCGGDFSVLDAEKVNAFYDCPGIPFMQLYTQFHNFNFSFVERLPWLPFSISFQANSCRKSRLTYRQRCVWWRIPLRVQSLSKR